MPASQRFKDLARKAAVEAEPGLTSAQLMLVNHDLVPVEKERRLWGPWNFVGFWIADSSNINTWMIASSMIAGGLSWWQAWLCVWIGYGFTGLFIILTGRIGAVYHINFPVVSRSSFGIWGSIWPVLNRVAMACIWYGVVAYIGGNCVYVMIRAIWPSWDRTKMPGPFNTTATSTPDYASFFIFWLFSLPALWFPVHRLRHLFTFKAYLVPLAAIAFLAWTLVRAHGIGPIINKPSQLHGSALAWEIVKGIMSSIANFAALIMNDPDFARFAKKPKDAMWSQAFAIPLSFAFTSLIGILVSSSSSVIFGETIWNPLNLLDRFLEGAGPAQRFGVFIIALAFSFAQLATNLAANSVSAGTDMAALLPRWINIRRGSYICAAIGIAICPYNFLADSNKFTTALSAYSVFLSSIAGVMVADYYFVRKGFLLVRDLYNDRKSGPYYFTRGLNWRAYAAYGCGIMINIVGFAGALGADVPKGAVYIFNLNYFVGFLVSLLAYCLICRLSPVPATSDVWMEIGDEVDDIQIQYTEKEVV